MKTTNNQVEMSTSQHCTFRTRRTRLCATGTAFILLIPVLVAGCSDRLIEAVKADDIARVREIILAGGNVNTTDSENRTPLWYAAASGNLELVGLLADAGADTGAISRYIGTPLHAAAVYDHVAIVEYLLEHGADVDARNRRDETPLWTAAHAGTAAVVSFLVGHGADVNATSGSWTPIHTACAFGNIEVVEVLVNSGADINRPDSSGKTPLHLAVMAADDREDIVSVLLQHGADPSRTDQSGDTPLMLTTHGGRPRCAERLSYAAGDE